VQRASSVAVDAQGRVFVAGTAGVGASRIAIFNQLAADGTVEAGTDIDLPDHEVTGNAVALQADGSIAVAGLAQSVTTGLRFLLVRLDSGGAIDPTFGTDGFALHDFGGIDEAHALALQADGRLIVAGGGGPAGLLDSDFVVARVDGGATVGIDTDSDGVLDAIEDAHPGGGDGNGDGTPDSMQDTVASLPNARDGRYVTFESSAGTTLADVRALSIGTPRDVELPFGSFGFTVVVPNPGDAATVTMYLPAGAAEPISGYFKFGATAGDVVRHWYEFFLDAADETGAELVDTDADGRTDRIRLSLLDGDRGDDDRAADGRIVDPGGPGNPVGGGRIAGQAFHDLDGDGRRGGAEPRLPGVTVTLRGPAGLLRTTTTDNGGFFAFGGLPIGSYVVGLTPPPGFVGALGYTRRTVIVGRDTGDPFFPLDRQRSVTLGDLNGDAIQDILALNVDEATVLLNTGGATFTGPTGIFGVGETAVIGRFDADPFPDVAIADADRAVRVLLGRGDGTFEAPGVDYRTGVEPVPVAIAAADFDGGGPLDLVVANRNDGTIVQLLNNGQGVFNVQAPIPVGSEPIDLDVADFNGDGDPDLAVALDGVGVRILLGTLASALLPFGPAIPVAGGVREIAAGLFDGDDFADLAVVLADANAVAILRGNGDGTFTEVDRVAIGGGEPNGITAADLDGDGDPDLSTANLDTVDVSVLLNVGDGRFVSLAEIPVEMPPAATARVTAGDVNGDGLADLVTSTFGVARASLLLGESGLFRRVRLGDDPTAFVSLGARAIAGGAIAGTLWVDHNANGLRDASPWGASEPSLAGFTVFVDLDDDGEHDDLVEPAVVADAEGGYRFDGLPAGSYAVSVIVPDSIFLGADLGLVPADAWEFTSPSAPTPGVQRVDVTDGATVANTDFGLRLHPGEVSGRLWDDRDGDGVLDPGEPPLPGREVFVDFNHNERRDAGEPFTVTDGDGRYTLAGLVPGRNNAVAVAQPAGWSQTAPEPVPERYEASAAPRAVHLADLDRDGDLDLATADPETDRLMVRSNRGDGVFGAPLEPMWPGTPGDAPVQMLSLDADGVGLPDLVAVNRDSDDITLWTDGGFASPFRIPVGDRPRAAAVLDFDGDGRDDLAVVTQDDERVHLLRNPGDTPGGWAVTGSFAPGLQPTGVRAADVDGDGHADLIVINQGAVGIPGSSGVRVFWGDGTGGYSAANSSGGTISTSISSVDVWDPDQDGDLDLLVARDLGAGGTILLWVRHDGGRTLVVPGDRMVGDPFDGTSTELPAAPTGPVIGADLDGDGARNDAAVMTATGLVAVFDFNGLPLFRQVAVGGLGASPVGLAAGDLDGDGDTDFAAGDAGAGEAVVVRGDGPRVFEVRTAGVHNVLLVPGQVTTDRDFLQVQLSVIEGLVWEDNDGDGAFDSGEPPLAGWTVFLDSSGDGAIQADEPQSVTDGQGRYRFADLVAGTYDVRLSLPPGWLAIAPAAAREVVTLEFADGATVDFAVARPGTVAGTVFHDLDGDGARQLLESGLTGWMVFLDFNDNGRLDRDEPTAFTDAQGSYRFEGVRPGAYLVGVMLRPTWDPTTTATPAAAFEVDRYEASQLFDPDIRGVVDYAVSDFNGDGLPDVALAQRVVGVRTPDVVTVLLNDRADPGRLRPGQVLPAGLEPRDLLAVDVNGDGLDDLVTAETESDRVSVFLNDGSTPGQFLTTVTFAVNDHPDTLTSADLNADGRPDLIARSQSQFGGVDELSVLINDAGAPGRFLPAQVLTLGFSGRAWRPTVVDLNRDGLLDLVVENSETISLLYQDPADPGRFQPEVRVAFPGFAVAEHPVVDDLNGDGLTDLAVGLGNFTTGLGEIQVLFNNDAVVPNSFLPAVHVPSPTGSVVANLSGGDFNRDGRPDLVTTGVGQVFALLNDPSVPQLFDVTPYATSRNLQAIADVTADGLADLVTLGFGQSGLSLLVNDASSPGRFLAEAVLPTGLVDTFGVFALEANGDALVDLVVTSNLPFRPGPSHGIAVLLNDPAAPGRFSEPVIIPVIQPSRNPTDDIQFPVVRDFNNDGRPDLALVDDVTGELAIALPTESRRVPVSVRSAQASTRDFGLRRDADDDGVPDVLEALVLGTGDGNRDAVPDSQQAHVASLPDPVSGGFVTLVSPAGTRLEGVQAVPNPSPADAPAVVSFPLGFFTFTVEGVTPGGAATVEMFLHGAPRLTTFYKYGPTSDIPTPHWYEFRFDGTTGAELIDVGNDGTIERIVLHLVDGGRGDADLLVNGSIVDPGGPAALAAPADRTGPTVVNLQRFGLHRAPTRFVLSFSEDLDPARAEDLGNYRLLVPGPDGRFGTRDDRTLRLRSASYDPATRTVTLAPARRRLPLFRRYILVARGTGAGALTDRAGNVLDGDGDGQSGGSFVRRFFGRRILSGRTPLGGTPTQRAIGGVPRGPWGLGVGPRSLLWWSRPRPVPAAGEVDGPTATADVEFPNAKGPPGRRLRSFPQPKQGI
jgi:hypothetical protein